MSPFAQTHINLDELMCLLALLRPPVRLENAIKRLYSNVILEFRDFPKTENARSREMKIVAFAVPKLTGRMSLFAQTHINLGELMCLLTLLRPPVRREIPIIRIYMHIIDFLQFPGSHKTRARVKWELEAIVTPSRNSIAVSAKRTH